MVFYEQSTAFRNPLWKAYSRLLKRNELPFVAE